MAGKRSARREVQAIQLAPESDVRIEAAARLKLGPRVDEDGAEMRQPSGRSAAQPQDGGSASCDDWQVLNEAGGEGRKAMAGA